MNRFGQNRPQIRRVPPRSLKEEEVVGIVSHEDAVQPRRVGELFTVACSTTSHRRRHKDVMIRGREARAEHQRNVHVEVDSDQQRLLAVYTAQSATSSMIRASFTTRFRF